MTQFRIGNGYDLHTLTEGRRCILGGVEIPSSRGPVGHSDGDCLTHAICDALLGAAGLTDIGDHFPDDDETYRDIDSQKLLRRVVALVRENGFAIENVDTTVIAETPKIGPHREKMKAALAASLGISTARVGVKATTNEGVDAVGRGEAVAAHAVCLLSGT